MNPASGPMSSTLMRSGSGETIRDGRASRCCGPTIRAISISTTRLSPTTTRCPPWPSFPPAAGRRRRKCWTPLCSRWRRTAICPGGCATPMPRRISSPSPAGTAPRGCRGGTTRRRRSGWRTGTRPGATWAIPPTRPWHCCSMTRYTGTKSISTPRGS